MSKLYVFLPCYNEAENISELIDRWIAMEAELEQKGYKLCVTVIDDKSTDNTVQIVKGCAEKYPQVQLIRHNKNLNLGGGVSTAFQTFNKLCTSGDLCVLMDGDNTHDPSYVVSMIDKIRNGADCVIASRYCNGSSVEGVPQNRLFLSDGAKIFYGAVLGVKNVRDYTCGYRIYTYDIISKALEYYGEDFVQMKSFSCMMEVLYKLYKIGAEFAEVPFALHYENKRGESKMRIFKTIKDSILCSLKLKFTV